MAQNEEVFKFLDGTTDNGASISFNVETKQDHYSANFERIINPVELIVEIETGNNVIMMISYDGGTYKTIDKVSSGCHRLSLDIDEKGVFPRCREISIAYREMSGSAVRIGQLAVNYYETEEQDQDDEQVEVSNNPVARSYN
jgi:hypothetical protein